MCKCSALILYVTSGIRIYRRSDTQLFVVPPVPVVPFHVAVVSERRQESDLKVAYSSCAAISCNASRGDE